MNNQKILKNEKILQVVLELEKKMMLLVILHQVYLQMNMKKYHYLLKVVNINQNNIISEKVNLEIIILKLYHQILYLDFKIFVIASNLNMFDL